MRILAQREPKPDRQKRPRSQPGPLTEKQIAELEKASPIFKRARRAVLKADANAERIKERLAAGVERK